MRYGFVIDQRKCIGCHACTVACKEENRVPLGAFRTWVKSIERGTFPDTRRYFSVLRCNHCEYAPCVAICPTVALYRRPDGIVDFDGARCIGCKSCMQACPYDALYIDPDTHTAAKCHYCAHRVEAGLLPACVIVCPEQAIVAGDLHDPRSRIARLVATEQVQVRKPEQGTGPKVFYLGADTAALTPALQTPAVHYAYATRPAADVDLLRLAASVQEANGQPGTSRPTYDVPHQPRPWGWMVGAYLWTKSVAAGALLVAALGVLSGMATGGRLSGVSASLVALVFLALTAGLLVGDLKHPARFHYVLLRGNPSSWLYWGGWILMAMGLVSVAWLAAAVAGRPGMLTVLAGPAILAAAATAGYSAFLFGQCEGRDFWQSPLLLPHLLVAALVAGASALAIVHVAVGGEAAKLPPLAVGLAVALGAHAVLLIAELAGAHSNVDAGRAARLLTRGGLRRRFWWGAVVAGIVLPLLLVWLGSPGIVLASALALAGLWMYEQAWLEAGQAIPLS